MSVIIPIVSKILSRIQKSGVFYNCLNNKLPILDRLLLTFAILVKPKYYKHKIFQRVGQKYDIQYKNWTHFIPASSSKLASSTSIRIRSGRSSSTFLLIFGLDQTNLNTIFTTNQSEKYPSSICCQDLNPGPSEHESISVQGTTTSFKLDMFQTSSKRRHILDQ